MGLDSQSEIITGESIIETLHRAEGFSTIEVEGDVARIDRDCALDVLDCVQEISRLGFDDAEQMKRIGMIGLRAEDRFVKSRRFRKFAGLVRSYSARHRVWKRQLDL